MSSEVTNIGPSEIERRESLICEFFDLSEHLEETLDQDARMRRIDEIKHILGYDPGVERNKALQLAHEQIFQALWGGLNYPLGHHTASTIREKMAMYVGILGYNPEEVGYKWLGRSITIQTTSLVDSGADNIRLYGYPGCPQVKKVTETKTSARFSETEVWDLMADYGYSTGIDDSKEREKLIRMAIRDHGVEEVRKRLSMTPPFSTTQQDLRGAMGRMK